MFVICKRKRFEMFMTYNNEKFDIKKRLKKKKDFRKKNVISALSSQFVRRIEFRCVI